MSRYVWIWGRAQAALDFFYHLQGQGGYDVFFAERWSDCVARMAQDGFEGRMYAFPDDNQCKQLSRFFNALSELPHYDLFISTPEMYRWQLPKRYRDKVADITFTRFRFKQMPLWQRILKRSFDVSASVFGLLLFSPLFLLCALLVKAGSKGPVFYSQERIGKNRLPFQIYKFRSMYVDAEDSQPQLSHAGDNRTTRWGAIMRRFHLDELPQFYNTLKGDMTMVSCYRPEREYFIGEIEKTAPYYALLAGVKPGITSRSVTVCSYTENVSQMVVRLSFEIDYLQNLSIGEDLRILGKTVRVVFFGVGK